jgi:hypothetical protein
VSIMLYVSAAHVYIMSVHTRRFIVSIMLYVSAAHVCIISVHIYILHTNVRRHINMLKQVLD